MHNRDIRLRSTAGRVGFAGFREAQPTARPFTSGLGFSNPNCSIFWMKLEFRAGLGWIGLGCRIGRVLVQA